LTTTPLTRQPCLKVSGKRLRPVTRRQILTAVTRGTMTVPAPTAPVRGKVPMTRHLLAGVLLGLAVAVAPSWAGELSPLAFGVRMVGIYPSADFDSRLGNGGDSMSSDWEPELTVEYYPTSAISLEYSLLFSQHSLSYGSGPQEETGATNLFTQGLTAKLHLSPRSTIDPYVGGGLNYLLPYDTHSTAQGFSLDSHLGWTVQAGFDLRLSRSLWFNADYRYMEMATTAQVNGEQYRFDISPQMIAFGVKYRY